MTELSLVDIAKALKPSGPATQRGQTVEKALISYHEATGYEVIREALAAKYGTSKSAVDVWAVQLLYALLVKEAGLGKLGIGMDRWL